MNTPPEFFPFPKIPRLSREMVITEKVDGTSGTIFIDDSGGIFAASRNRWLTPAADNYGFAKWVEGNKNELLKLGPGWHRGEFWGQGIQRGYGLAEKRFSLFDVDRWIDPRQHPLGTKFTNDKQALCPACCSVVPVLHRGIFSTSVADQAIEWLRERGSKAAPGFMQPEGVVIYHTASRTYFKKTIVGDSSPKTLDKEIKEAYKAQYAMRFDSCAERANTTL